jgi:hypothetical protein
MNRWVDGYNAGSFISTNFEHCLGAFFAHLAGDTDLADNTVRLHYFYLSTFIKWLQESESISDLQ